MSVGSDVREWAASAWEGGITNVGWFWAVIAIILNVLATSLIVAAVVEGGQTERVLNRVALAALIPVVVLASLQVPYRGQRMRAQRRIEEKDAEIRHLKGELETLRARLAEAGIEAGDDKPTPPMSDRAE